MAAAKYNQRTRQEKSDAPLIGPLIVTRDDVQSTHVPDAFCRIVVTRTVCRWSSVNKIATVQIANPSGRHVHLKRKNVFRLCLVSNIRLDPDCQYMRTDWERKVGSNSR